MPPPRVHGVHVTAHFVNVPATATAVRVTVRESVVQQAPLQTPKEDDGEEESKQQQPASSNVRSNDRAVFIGPEQARDPFFTFVRGPRMRLVLLPAEARQRFIVQLSDTHTRQVLGQIVLDAATLLRAKPDQLFKLGPAEAAAVNDDALASEPRQAEEQAGDFGVRFDVEAGYGVSLEKERGSVVETPHHTAVDWADYPNFDHSAARAAVLRDAATGDAEFFEIELAVSGLFGLDALTKASPLVSIHTSDGRAALIDHTEVVPSSHSATFKQRLVLQCAQFGRSTGNVLFRVYDAAPGGGELIESGSASLLGESEPVKMSTLELARKTFQVELPLSARDNPALDKKLKKKQAKITLVSVKKLGEHQQQQQASSGLNVDVSGNDVAPSARLSVRKKVAGSSPFDAATATPAASGVVPATNEIVIVDARGREHYRPVGGAASPRAASPRGGAVSPRAGAASARAASPRTGTAASTAPRQTAATATAASSSKAFTFGVAGEASSPKSPSKQAGERISLAVTASNLLKLRALASAASPLVALWERVVVPNAPVGAEPDYKLLAHTEVVSNDADAHFVGSLSFLLGPFVPPPGGGLLGSMSPRGSPSVSKFAAEQFRVDVYDVSGARVDQVADRIGSAFLSREDLRRVHEDEAHEEVFFPLRAPERPSLDKKLAAKDSGVALSRAGASAEQIAERQAAKAERVANRRLAIQQKKDVWIANRKAQQDALASHAVAAASASTGASPRAAGSPTGAGLTVSAGTPTVVTGASPAASPKQAEQQTPAAKTPAFTPAALAAAAAVPLPAAEEEEKKTVEPAGLPPRAGGAAAPIAAAPIVRAAGSRRNSLDGTVAPLDPADAAHLSEMNDAILAERVAQAKLDAAQKAFDAHKDAKGKKAEAEQERLANELKQAQEEVARASERAAAAKEALAARRRARAEAEAAEAALKAQQDEADKPNMTPWGLRHQSRRTASGQIVGVTAGTGSGRTSRRGSLNLTEDDAASGQRADIKDLVQARRMAALSEQAAAQASLLPNRAAAAGSSASSGSSDSSILAFGVSVRNVKHSGAWNPCVSVYEYSGMAGASKDGAQSERWVYLDHTEKLVDVGTTGTGAFNRQLLVEYFPSGSEALSADVPAQLLRFNLFNAGSKDVASAADLIASGNIPLASLASLAGPEPNGGERVVEVMLYAPHNKALSDRLKRQHACIRLTLLQKADGAAGLGPEAGTGHHGRTLVLGTAPVPLTMEGGADPDPAAVQFQLADLSKDAEQDAAAAAAALAGPAASGSAPGSAKASPAGSKQGTPAGSKKTTPAASPEASDNEEEPAAAAAPEAQAEAAAAAAPEAEAEAAPAAGGDKKKKKKKGGKK